MVWPLLGTKRVKNKLPNSIIIDSFSKIRNGQDIENFLSEKIIRKKVGSKIKFINKIIFLFKILLLEKLISSRGCSKIT